MVYGCGCVVFFRPSLFMTSAEMRFFWLLLSTMNYSGEPLTHIYQWKRHSPSSRSSGSILWIFVAATMALSVASIFPSLCQSPYWVLIQSRNLCLIWKPSARPPMTTWLDNHLYCDWSSYGTHTIFLCPSSSSWCCSLLAAMAGCPR